MTLKTQGYTDLQIRVVGGEWGRRFKGNGAETRGQESGGNTTANSREKTVITQAEKMRKNLEDQKQEANSKFFKHDRTGNKQY